MKTDFQDLQKKRKCGTLNLVQRSSPSAFVGVNLRPEYE